MLKIYFLIYYFSASCKYLENKHFPFVLQFFHSIASDTDDTHTDQSTSVLLYFTERKKYEEIREQKNNSLNFQKQN